MQLRSGAKSSQTARVLSGDGWWTDTETDISRAGDQAITGRLWCFVAPRSQDAGWTRGGTEAPSLWAEWWQAMWNGNTTVLPTGRLVGVIAAAASPKGRCLAPTGADDGELG